jgi:hypothetical protein
LPAALFEVSGFRIGTLVVFCAAHRILSFACISLRRPGRLGPPNHELYHPKLVLTSPADELESPRFETAVGSNRTKFLIGGAYVLRFLHQG